MILYKYCKRGRNILGRFNFHVILGFFYILGAFLIKKIIPLTLDGYQMILANSILCASLATASYSARARGIIVKYEIPFADPVRLGSNVALSSC